MIAEGHIRREEVFVSTKVGIMPQFLADPIRKGNASDGFGKVAIDNDGFCFDPEYIEWQILRSLKTMMIDTVDCLFLHNIEAVTRHLGKRAFFDKLLAIIPLLEKFVTTGLIRTYGIASWDAFRVLEDHPEHIDLSMVFGHLDKAGIKYDNFKFIQLPIGIWGTEAITVKSQNASSLQPVSILNYALKRGISVLANSALLQGDLLKCDLSVIPGQDLLTPIQRAINFSRSIPGVSSILVGIKSQRSIIDAIKVMNVQYFDFKNGWGAKLSG